MNMKKTTSILILTLSGIALFLTACDLNFSETSTDTFNSTLRGTWVSLSSYPYANGKLVINYRDISIDYPGSFYPENTRPFSELPPKTQLKGYSEKTGDVPGYPGHKGIMYINVPGEDPMLIDYTYYITGGKRRLTISYAEWKDTFQPKEDE
jgi:hypothetical protein